MHRTRIKICGIKDPDTAVAAADAGADFIGLVFVEKSPRAVSVAQARAVETAAPTNVVRVGLFADHSAQQINDICTQTGLMTVQLHGHEPISLLDQLQGQHVIRALPFDDQAIDLAMEWQQHERVFALLLDSPQTGALTGGGGVRFDWSRLAKVRDRFHKRLILAGGLTPENVGEAIHIVRPYAVDVSSGVESSRGMKDVQKIRAFCDAVREADKRLQQ